MPPARRFTSAGHKSTKIDGIDLPWEFGAEEDSSTLKIQAQPVDLFPVLRVYPPRPARRSESRTTAYFISLRDHINNGPLYATMLTNVDYSRAPKVGSAYSNGNSQKALDLFEALPTFTHRFEKNRNRIPNFTKLYNPIKYYPRELWSVFGVKAVDRFASGTGNLTTGKLRSAHDIDNDGISGDDIDHKTSDLDEDDDLDSDENIEDEDGNMDDDDDGDPDEEVSTARRLARKRKNRLLRKRMLKNLPDTIVRELDEQDVIVEDDVFDEDEDDPDDADDYNAERYFDPGEEEDYANDVDADADDAERGTWDD